MAKAVFCIVNDRSRATEVVKMLRDGGFSNTDISLLMPDKANTPDVTPEHGAETPEDGAASGARTGSMLGAGIGLVLGLGSLAIPGVGPFIAAGPILAALGGGAVGAALGGTAGAIGNLGVPETEAKRYESRLAGGNVLVCVHSEDSAETARARDIFERAGAEDISTVDEAFVPGHERTKTAIGLR